MSGKFDYLNDRNNRIVLAILVLSFILRVILVFRGGQYFFPDESRYDVSRVAANALWSGDIVHFLKKLHSAVHFLFKVIGVLPATLQIIFGKNPKIPALFFSLFSVANIWLIWGIMRRIGENERVSLLSVSLFALSSTQLYYSRHLVPYDVAMSFGLFAIFIGLRKPIRVIDSILCGFFSSCCFLTYNGYWLIGGFAASVHILQKSQIFYKTVIKALFCVIGLISPIVFIISISKLLGGDLLRDYIRFSNSVTQGSFSEGWSLPIEYFWYSEHILILLWLVALLFGLWDSTMGSRKESVKFGIFGVIFIYGALIIFSVFLEKFVVYGRLARQMVPFFSILSALFLDRFWSSNPKRKPLVIAILLIMICQAALNFKPLYTQTFPSDFLRIASEASGQSFPTKPRGSFSGASVTAETEEYQVLFAHYIYPVPQPVTEYGEIILQRSHPQQFLPYQYEGYTPDQRNQLRSIDISMKLVRKKIR